MPACVRHINLVIFLFLMLAVSGQNLVYNPSFELYTNCPQHLGSFHKDVLHWSAPTAGSTDYFNACSEAMGTPENFNGAQRPRFGEGYAGIYLYAPDDYREYLQANLITGLVKGERYLVSFYVSLAERSDFAISDFGLCFSDQAVVSPIKNTLTKMQLYKNKGHQFTFLDLKNGKYLKNSRDWYKVEGAFTAKGGERYLVIGNFKNNIQTRKHHLKKRAKQGAYYYIDMVEVRPERSVLSKNKLLAVGQSGKGEIYRLDKTHVFKDVLFVFDDHLLSATAMTELDRVYDFMKADPKLSIEINGHTDDIGSPRYNQKLSKKRCQAVVRYLKGLGLQANRIRWKAHGSQVPVAENTTEEGRAKNRRVEFVFRYPELEQ